MTFSVPAESYDRFIGRYSRELAPRFLDFAAFGEGPALDVGCGPGSLAAALAERIGAAQVAAVDVAEPFVAECRARVPGADVRVAPAEDLPFGDGSFRVVLSQLVLSFVRGPERAAAEMRRVARAGGTVAACTFEADGFALARTFWTAALRFDPAAPDDAALPFRRLDELERLWSGAGLRDVVTGVLEIDAAYDDFDDFWLPFAAGVGPTVTYLAAQTGERRAAIREACRELLGCPAGPFRLPARVLAIRGRA
ncbi:MAG: class I SAM-dependent methyltransferase [Acidobacteria bacterium]|nr:class I SAM-dependent methyltransferase [Acidobacteriota bacterium]